MIYKYMQHNLRVGHVCAPMCTYVNKRSPGVVVGAGAQDVTQRVPGQTPDHPLMGHLHASHLLLHPAKQKGL